MRIIPYTPQQVRNRYSVAIFDVLGIMVIDVQRAANTIRDCRDAICKYTADVPFACATIYRINATKQAIPVKHYSPVDVLKMRQNNK